jgi:hypothetical protein
MNGLLRLVMPLVAALLLPAMASAQTSVYRWVDKDGKVQYSDAPPADPAANATQKRFGGGMGSDSSQLPYATQVAMQRFPVTLYFAADCGDPCRQGRELLVKRGIPFSERDAVASKEETETVKKLSGGLFVPVLTVGPNVLKGYREEAWHAALDTAGYPRALLPGQARPRPPEPPKAAPAPPPAPADAPPASDAGQPPAQAPAPR